MRKKLLVQCSMILLLLAPHSVLAWFKTYGNPNSTNWGSFVLQTADDGFIVTGAVGSLDGDSTYDLWLLKTDSLGDSLWARVFGTNNGEDDAANCVQITDDEGYIIVGYTGESNAGVRDLKLIKVDSMGGTQWERNYGGSNQSAGLFAEQTFDGGYIVTGSTYVPDSHGVCLWLFKTDSEGTIQWERTFGSGARDYGCCVRQTSDTGFVVAGTKGYRNETEGVIGTDLWLLKTDMSGDIIWEHSYVDGWESDQIGYSVQQTADGGYIVSGCRDSIFDLWLLKTDSNGDTVWTRNYGGEGGRYVRQTSDGNYITVSKIGSEPCDLRLLTTDPDGNLIWSRTFGLSEVNLGKCVEQTSDGGYVITGGVTTQSPPNSQLFLIKTDSLGYAAVSEPTPVTPVTPATPVTPESDFDIISPIGPRITLRFTVSMKPLQVSIFDASGKKVDEIDIPRTGGVVRWGYGMNPGVYFIRVESNASNSTRKVILTK